MTTYLIIALILMVIVNYYLLNKINTMEADTAYNKRMLATCNKTLHKLTMELGYRVVIEDNNISLFKLKSGDTVELDK